MSVPFSPFSNTSFSNKPSLLEALEELTAFWKKIHPLHFILLICKGII